LRSGSDVSEKISSIGRNQQIDELSKNIIKYKKELKENTRKLKKTLVQRDKISEQIRQNEDKITICKQDEKNIELSLARLTIESENATNRTKDNKSELSRLKYEISNIKAQSEDIEPELISLTAKLTDIKEAQQYIREFEKTNRELEFLPYIGHNEGRTL